MRWERRIKIAELFPLKVYLFALNTKLQFFINKMHVPVGLQCKSLNLLYVYNKGISILGTTVVNRRVVVKTEK